MDLSKLPDAQRQELEQLQKQFQEHQALQQQQQSAAAAAAAAAVAAAAVQQHPPAYDQSQVQQSYDPSQAYDQSYYYNYNYQDPSQLQQHQQYDASYYHNYYPSAYQQPPHDPYTHPPAEQQRNAESGSGSLGLGQGQAHVQDTYVHPANPGYPVPPGLNAAAAAAVAALSQLTQFAGSMAERTTGGGYVGQQGHFDQGQGQGHFRPPPVGHHPAHPPPSYRGGGRRGGGPFRGGGRGNFGFRPPSSGGHGPPFHGRGRGGRGRGRGGRPDHPASSHPVEGAKPSEGGGGGAEPSVKIAWCELCRVDCTSKEILETHKNGKRHQKNLQRQQEMKGEYKPVAEPEKVEKPGSEMNITVPENETKADDDREKKPWMKRKLKGGGGRGGKRQRLGATGPPKPKVVIPLMCDLCNVKCDTQEVFDRHVGGKKHIAKLKRFQGHQAMYGPTAVQALYPPNPLLQSQAQSQSLSLGPTLTQPPNIAAPPPAPTYVPPQNPNPQLADAPLQFGTQNAAAAAASEPPQLA